jgi:hypothetical protein
MDQTQVADNKNYIRLESATSDGVMALSNSSPLATAAAANPPSAWLIALHSLATGVTWATILVTASLALEYDLGISRLLFAAVAGFMGFAFLAAGEGIVVLVWKVLGALFARLGLARGTTP